MKKVDGEKGTGRERTAPQTDTLMKNKDEQKNGTEWKMENKEG